MIVLFWTSTIGIAGGKTLAFPIAVPDDDLDAFGERLARDGGVMVDRLQLERRPDGYAYIVEVERMFLSIAATATIRNNNMPVRREVDDDPQVEPVDFSEMPAQGAAR